MFTKYEKKILRKLYTARRQMSLRSLAERTEMSPITIRKYLTKLFRRGLVRRVRKNKRIFYEFNYGKLR